MIDRGKVQARLKDYPLPPVVGAVASHSALDAFDGASAEGFRTLAICQRGREKTYSQYYRAFRDVTGNLLKGCVDTAYVLEKFDDILDEGVQEKLRQMGTLLVPNRALSSYVPIDEVEEKLALPILGSRAMLRIEERSERENYYTLLEKAQIPTPHPVVDVKQIEGLSIVKLPHAKKRLERGFFTCASHAEFLKKSGALLAQGTVTQEDLDHARVEQYIIGPVFNLNFFLSPLAPRIERLELLGVDERRESSLDGMVRLPAEQQLALPETARIPEYTVVGHGSLTLRESLLEEALKLGEKFVDAAKERYPPGIIGPFCLQTCVDKDGKPFVFDVAVRLGGGTNIHMSLGHPYGNTLWRVPMSSGRRLAFELRRALDEGRLEELVT
ncbi:MAG: formate--phosphoribosylaminoimidazolecarboxamide ligase family protein [Euryarchaeota archaeon]|nr:formate--phosphoribosylaminoimidazolecarboxamide ligase family protein [Euryarchaeota archaeon]MDE1835552.1 formate--phosphoribosylaminoimidazolecarboxamide ligase family protein [Euryarchaeota archaeon]MDE1879643.1 formate--phosphoribosylaminoimidazolecarboxamide ligase family protein [Euryarchaeota archaeon]MDE2043826.1 formate--phosphoribosylaminoimidazolecarboxamide ligase family protein [Thermoplasmata archaeon]